VERGRRAKIGRDEMEVMKSRRRRSRKREYTEGKKFRRKEVEDQENMTKSHV